MTNLASETLGHKAEAGDPKAMKTVETHMCAA